jgi:uncharacterized membrane protein
MQVGRYIFSGIVTVIPLWITWVVFEFVLRQLAQFGRPVAAGVTSLIANRFPEYHHGLDYRWIEQAMAVSVTLVGLYLLGWLATRVLGRRIIEAADSIFARIPLIQRIYGAAKRLLTTLRKKPEGSERVVLVEFPHRGMRAVGLVTRVMSEPESGRKLAIVYVPTTPIPTSGFMEIVPLDRLVTTDWTLDEAMNFIMSAGAVSPEQIHFSSTSDHRHDRPENGTAPDDPR